MRHAEGVTTRARTPGRASAGFSLVELLVTITLAGILFMALTPLFVSILKNTSTNERRVIATNLAQARLERVRMIAYADITNANLTSSTFAAGAFNPSFTAAHGGAPYTITMSCSPTANPTAAYKTVWVTITRGNDNFKTTSKTVVMNPAAVQVSSTSGPGGGSGPFSLTVAFKNSSEVVPMTSPTPRGVYIVQKIMNTALPTPTPTATVTISPTQAPAASPTNSTINWTNLPGGSGYLYIVYCNSKMWTSSVLQTPPFHMFSNGWVKFDTNP
ncbi:MAG TPA: type II secretion system protein, partial [Thermoleophilia bacterium]|nr:type II secretion system protein [Thermoleophilia bacterium]